MKAVIQTGYGSADVMKLKERDRPTPGEGEVLVRVMAASLAAGECHGSCAEYAVAVPTSACTALQGIRDQGKVRAGHKVLINGASGGVGPFAVQIAKALGAEVTGVCSRGNVEMVRGIGADHVIDYTKEDFTKGSARYNVIMDNVASHSLSATRRVLTPDGLHVPSSGHAGMGWVIAAVVSAVLLGLAGLIGAIGYLVAVSRHRSPSLLPAVQADRPTCGVCLRSTSA